MLPPKVLTMKKVAEEINNAPWRGSPPEFFKQHRTAPVNSVGDPVNHRQKEIYNLKNKLSDTRARLKRLKDSSEARKQDEDHSRMENEGEEAFQNSQDFANHMLYSAEKRFEKLIGPSSQRDGHQSTTQEGPVAPCPTIEPNENDSRDIEQSISEAEDMHKRCCSELEKIATSRGLERRRAKRELTQWDWDKNYGRRAFQNS